MNAKEFIGEVRLAGLSKVLLPHVDNLYASFEFCNADDEEEVTQHLGQCLPLPGNYKWDVTIAHYGIPNYPPEYDDDPDPVFRVALYKCFKNTKTYTKPHVLVGSCYINKHFQVLGRIGPLDPTSENQ